MEFCPTCTRTQYSPYRVYNRFGVVIEGCVDDFHTGHLVTPSESYRWHHRKEAKKIRQMTVKHFNRMLA